MTTADGRVVGYAQDLGRELTPSAAEEAALAVLPGDARVVRSEVLHENGSCKILVVQSDTLRRLFRRLKIEDASGLVEIDLYGTDPETGESTYPANLSEAAVGLGEGPPHC